jgi:hypothetical protein
MLDHSRVLLNMEVLAAEFIPVFALRSQQLRHCLFKIRIFLRLVLDQFRRIGDL